MKVNTLSAHSGGWLLWSLFWHHCVPGNSNNGSLSKWKFSPWADTGQSRYLMAFRLAQTLQGKHLSFVVSCQCGMGIWQSGRRRDLGKIPHEFHWILTELCRRKWDEDTRPEELTSFPIKPESLQSCLKPTVWEKKPCHPTVSAHGPPTVRPLRRSLPPASCLWFITPTCARQVETFICSNTLQLDWKKWPPGSMKVWHLRNSIWGCKWTKRRRKIVKYNGRRTYLPSLSQSKTSTLTVLDGGQMREWGRERDRGVMEEDEGERGDIGKRWREGRKFRKLTFLGRHTKYISTFLKPTEAG